MNTEPSAAAMRAAFPLLNALDDLATNWRRQDDELAGARQGLEPEDRLNEQAEDQRVNDIRHKQIAQIIDRETGLAELLQTSRTLLLATDDCLPISGDNPRIDVLYYKQKLSAIFEAAQSLRFAIITAEGGPK